MERSFRPNHEAQVLGGSRLTERSAQSTNNAADPGVVRPGCNVVAGGRQSRKRKGIITNAVVGVRETAAQGPANASPPLALASWRQAASSRIPRKLSENLAAESIEVRRAKSRWHLLHCSRRTRDSPKDCRDLGVGIVAGIDAESCLLFRIEQIVKVFPVIDRNLAIMQRWTRRSSRSSCRRSTIA